MLCGFFNMKNMFDWRSEVGQGVDDSNDELSEALAMLESEEQN